MKIKVRVTIMFAMIGLVLISSFTIIFISYTVSLKSVNYILNKLIDSVSTSAIEKSINYFNPINKVLKNGEFYQKLLSNNNITNSKSLEISKTADIIVQNINPDLLNKYNISEDSLKLIIINNMKKMQPTVEFSQKNMELYKEFRSIEGSDPEKNFMAVIRMPDDSLSIKYVFPFVDSKKTNFVISVWNHNNKSYYTENVKNPVSGKFADYKNNIQLANEDDVYNPVNRSWYTGAQENLSKAKSNFSNTEIFWSNPRIFFSDEAPGVSASLPVLNKSGEISFVYSINIGTIGISIDNLSQLKIGKSGRVMILNENSDLIAYSPDISTFKNLKEKQNFINNELRSLITQIPLYNDTNNPKKITGYDFDFTNIKESKDKLYTISYDESGIKKYKNNNGKVYLHETIKSHFHYKNINYLTVFIPFPKDFQWHWILGIIIPEDDFMGEVKTYTFIAVIFSIICFILSIIIAIILSSMITKSLNLLVEEANEIKMLNLDSSGKIKTSLYELDKMGEAFYNMKIGLRSFEKYVPSEVVRYLMQSGKEAILGGEQKKLTILFSDIENFTTIAESMAPKELVNALGDYLKEMSNIILKNEGTIDKYIGDAIMAFWGAPKEIEDHAYLACKSAIENQELLRKLRKEKWLQENRPLFNARIGINTGELIVGNMGSDTRLNYTVIGDSVNLASRLEGINKYYKTNIICSENTYKLIKDRIVTRKLDIVSVKGKTKPESIFEIIGLKGKVSDKYESFIQIFEDAFYYYSINQFRFAYEKFQKAKEINPYDKTTRIFIERCVNNIKNPPDKNWNGVYIHTEK